MKATLLPIGTQVKLPSVSDTGFIRGYATYHNQYLGQMRMGYVVELIFSAGFIQRIDNQIGVYVSHIVVDAEYVKPEDIVK